MRLEPLAAVELPPAASDGVVTAPGGGELRFRLEGRLWEGDDNVVCLFETDDDRWHWLNEEICVVTGGELFLCVNELSPRVARAS